MSNSIQVKTNVECGEPNKIEHVTLRMNCVVSLLIQKIWLFWVACFLGW